MDYRDEMDAALTRFDQFAHRHDRGGVPRVGRRRGRRRGTAARSRRIAMLAMVIMGLILATIGFGLFVGPIGLRGLFLVAMLMLGVLLAVSAWPGGPRYRPVPPYQPEMSNQAVVQRLGAVLQSQRAALPAAAARRVEQIGAQLPLLESRLAALDPLDPLAQDARRLIGEHLPELIDRYERVPARYRHERDGEGKSVDERLVAGLDAARGAIDELSRELTREDLSAFQTQGRFLESRYRNDPAAGS